MSFHLYRRPRHVTFVDKRFLGPGWSGDFVVVRHLPPGDETPGYGIGSTGEAYSRFAYDNQLATSFTIFR